MRIVELRAENFKRLKAVRIKPDGSVVEITGKNAAGKSSVLDAIWSALGGAGASPDKPIRDGAKKAEVTLNLGDYIVKRRWTKGGTYLDLTAKGMAVASPQKIIDGFLGRIGFDPLAFSRMKPAEQADTLREMTGLDVSDLDKKEEGLVEERKIAGRELKQLEARLSGAPEHDDAPKEPVSVAELSKRLDDANATLRANDELRTNAAHAGENVTRANERVRVAGNDVVAARESLAAAEEKLKAAEHEFDTLEATREEATSDAGDCIDPDTAAITAAIADADAANEKVRANKAHAELSKRVDEARDVHERLEADITATREERRTRIADTPMPVDGLAVDDEAVAFKGVPFSQASQSEKIAVGVAIQAASGHDLRVITIHDGSLIDKDGMAALAKVADENDYQILVERVAGESPTGIVIEDGEVKS